MVICSNSLNYKECHIFIYYTHLLISFRSKEYPYSYSAVFYSPKSNWLTTLLNQYIFIFRSLTNV